MVSNSFKFLALALAAALTVAPISADWNSNSSRFGLAGLGFAVASVVGIMVYNYFSGKNTSKQEHKPTVNREEGKHRLYTILATGNFSMNDHEVKSILGGFQNDKLTNLVENLNEINKSFLK